MNWFARIAQAYSPEDIIQGVLNNNFDGSGPSLNLPEGGWAYQQMKMIGPVACEAINTAAAADASAPAKMKILSDAAGCPWNPELPGQQQEQPGLDPMMPMPAMGEQEKPMDLPSTEIA